jgi:hypothetical protein
MEQTGKHGPRQDEQLSHEVAGEVQSGRRTRAEEWREPEPADEQGRPGEVNTLPEDRRGSPPGMTHADVEARSEIARFLDPSMLPADRDALVASAESHQAPGPVLDRLRSLPAGQRYENVQAVARALGIGTEAHRT